MRGSKSLSDKDRRDLKRFALEMSLVFAAGMSVILFLPKLVSLVPAQSLLWLLINLSPISIIFLAIWVGVRNDRRSDEYHRDLQRRAIYIAFFGTGVVTFAYGLLEMTGMPRLSMLNVWLVMTVMWVAGWCAVAAQEYWKRNSGNG